MKKEEVTAHRRAHRFINQLIAEYGLKVTNVFEDGPRFFVALVRYKRKRALLKVCFHPKSRDPWTNRKFGKEILFLQYLAQSRHAKARALAPHLYVGGVGPRAWYIREYLDGMFYNINGGNIRYRDAFFTKPNLEAIVASFKDLQSIRSGDLPADFRKLLRRYDTISYLWKLLNPYWGRIGSSLNDRGAKGDLPKILLSRKKIFDASPAVLTHQEPYASHFVRKSGRLRLIDWENISWSNPVHDYTNLWMRSQKHPAWQAALKEKVRNTTRPLLKDTFEDIWETSILIKALFNVSHFPYYAEKADFLHLERLSRRILKSKLREWRKSR